MFLATAETLTQPYDIMDIVYVGFVAVSPMKNAISGHAEKLAEDSFDKARRELARRAATMGADAVIAMRVAPLSWGSGGTSILVGTAIKFR